MQKTLLLIIIALVWPCLNLTAETIYQWKDKNGVLRFSNEPPPEEVQQYKKTESTPSSDPGNQRRAEYDHMVNKAVIKTKNAKEQEKKEAVARAEEKKRLAEKERQKRIQAARKELERRMEAIKKRAVSPTYPNGLKQAQIEKIKKEIEKLEAGSGTANSQ